MSNAEYVIPDLEMPNHSSSTTSSACYENPLFEEDGKVLNDTNNHVQHTVATDTIKAKDFHYEPGKGVPTRVHYKRPGKRRTLYILAFVIGVLVVIGLIVGIIVGQKDSPEQSTATSPDKDEVLFRTIRVDASLRIFQGPFSTFVEDYTNKLSDSYQIFSSSFIFKIDSIFANGEFSLVYSHTDIVNVSSGSVVVQFTIFFRQGIAVTSKTAGQIRASLAKGLLDSVFVIDPSSLQVTPEDPSLSVITTLKPGTCEEITLQPCINKTGYHLITFPDVLGHVSSVQSAAAAERYSDLFFSHCGADFWCTVFNPRCHNSKGVPPCRSYCEAVYTTCKGKYQTDVEQLLPCSSLPESTNPNICTPDPYKAGTCVAFEEPLCQKYEYSSTYVPNFSGNRNPFEKVDLLHLLNGINHATHCYKHTVLFGCAAFLPQCTTGHGGVKKPIPPCRSLCEDFRARCEIFMEMFWEKWPENLFCSDFPDSPDPNICVGYKEAHEPPQPNECTDGEFRCDNNTCIPLGWRCDDYQDCKDDTDEAPIVTQLPIQRCAVCPPGSFRCAPQSTMCIEESRRCDGVEDCYLGSDERECVQIGDGGRSGVLTVLNPISGDLEPVCSAGWTDYWSSLVCTQLGYKRVLETRLDAITSSPSIFTRRDQVNGSDASFLQSYLERSGSCIGGQVVNLTCAQPECGNRPSFYYEPLRIVGGDTAQPGAWPWQASMYGGLGEKYFCGGSILAEHWILTAGHCVGGRRDPTYLTLKVGQPRRDTYSPYLQKLHVEKIYLNPDFNPHTVENDIALLKVKEAIRFNDHVRPICLPEKSGRIPVGTRCTAIGWGKRNETAIYYERSMKEVPLEVVDQDECNAAILGAVRKVPYRLNEDMFCAGGGLNHDACSGDSGGPLLCYKNREEDTWFVAGVVSWGVGCAYFNVPGVYTLVPSYLGWIRNVTGLDYL